MSLVNTDLSSFQLKENCLFGPLLSGSFSNNDNCKVELIRIPGEAATSSYIKDNNEILVVVQGSGGLTIDGASKLIKMGDIIHIPSNSVRSISNIDNQYLQVVSIKSLASA